MFAAVAVFANDSGRYFGVISMLVVVVAVGLAAGNILLVVIVDEQVFG